MPQDSPKTLIIYLSYAGLGDSLFYSHLPRIAKTANIGGGITIKSIFSLFIILEAMIIKGLFGRRIPMSMECWKTTTLLRLLGGKTQA